MRSDQKFGILFNRGFICIPIYYKKEIIFVGNIYFRIHLKVYLLSNQKLFLLYVNNIREISSCRSYHFFSWTRGFIPNCAHLFQCSLFVLFIAARRQPLRLCREACFRYIIEVFSLCVCVSVCLSVSPHKWNSIYIEIPFIIICAEFWPNIKIWLL